MEELCSNNVISKLEGFKVICELSWSESIIKKARFCGKNLGSWVNLSMVRVGNVVEGAS